MWCGKSVALFRGKADRQQRICMYFICNGGKRSHRRVTPATNVGGDFLLTH